MVRKLIAACLIGALLALGSLAAGCGGDEAGKENGGTASKGATASEGTASEDGATGEGGATTGATGAAGETGAGARSQPASSQVEIKMTEFKFIPRVLTVESGSVTIKAPNLGNAVHELVLFKTDADPASFKVRDGKVDESEVPGEDVGEIADVDPGKTKQTTFKLESGRYAMICNIPGHYQAGMYGSLRAG